MQKDWISLGLMSGTSGDGVDASVIRTNGINTYELIKDKYYEYDSDIYKDIHNLKEKNINDLKVLLANEATRILHGKSASKKAEQTAKDTFTKGGLGSDLPEIEIQSNEIKKGIYILDLIVKNKILPSKSEVRRAIANKGFKIDDILIEDEKKMLRLKDFKKNILKLSYGKKKHYLVKII